MRKGTVVKGKGKKKKCSKRKQCKLALRIRKKEVVGENIEISPEKLLKFESIKDGDATPHEKERVVVNAVNLQMDSSTKFGCDEDSLFVTSETIVNANDEDFIFPYTSDCECSSNELDDDVLDPTHMFLFDDFNNDKSNAKIKLLMKHKDIKIYSSPADSILTLKGSCRIRMIIGKVLCYGYEITSADEEYVDIFSPASHSYISLETQNDSIDEVNLDKFPMLDNDTRATLKNVIESNRHSIIFILKSYINDIGQYLQNLHINLHLVGRYSMASKKVYPEIKNKSFTFSLSLANENLLPTTLILSDKWKDASNQILGFKNPVILVCGGTNVGKSTFVKFLVNQFLSRQKSKASNKGVWYVEADPGQSEFVVPGCVSLKLVKDPILGPPYLNLSQTSRCLFVGGTSMADNPDLYISSMEEIFISLKNGLERKAGPIVINTMGWGKGLGLNLLSDVIRIFKPTHVVQIRAGVQRDILADITPSFMSTKPGWRYSPDMFPSHPFNSLIIPSAVSSTSMTSNVFTGSFKRSLSILAYFGQMQDNVDKVKPINHFTPFKIDFSSIFVKIFHHNVPDNHIISALNGSVVALCYISSNKVNEAIIHETCDGIKLLNESLTSDCIGYGIVRAINNDTKFFYVITPLSIEEMRKVNFLMVGGMELPEVLLSSQKYYGTLHYIINGKKKKSFIDKLVPTKLLRRCPKS